MWIYNMHQSTQIYWNHKNNINERSLKFKKSKITSQSGLVLGYEFSISSSDVPNEVDSNIYYIERLFPNFPRTLVSHIENMGQNLRDFEGKTIFFNLERTHLCDNFLLCEIILLKEKLSIFGVKLVVVITQHKHSNPWKETRYGLELLKCNNIALATNLPSLSSHCLSVLSHELKHHYSFIKVEHKHDIYYYKNLKDISESNKCKLIVNKINSESDLLFINCSNIDIWGYQGLKFN